MRKDLEEFLGALAFGLVFAAVFGFAIYGSF